MPPAPADRRLILAAGASLLIHLIVGVAAVSLHSHAGAGQPRQGMDPARLPPPDPDRDPNRSVDVGNPTSQTTTLTWIGYDQYIEHASPRPKDVEQPAVRIEASGALAEAGAGQAEQVAVDPQPATEASDQPGAAPTAAAQPAEPQDQPAEQQVAEAQSPEPAESVAVETETVEQPEPLQPRTPIAVIAQADDVIADEPVERVATPPNPQRPDSATAQPAATVVPETEPRPQIQPGAPTPTPGDRTVGADVGAPHENQGRQDTRDADFAAIRAAERVRLGQPVAAKGLRINTVKPRGTHLHSIMAMYTDPVVRVFFDRSGKVRDVKFIRRSQHADVDRYVLNAVFQWTAEGEELLKLPVSAPDEPPQMVFVDFVIVRPLSG